MKINMKKIFLSAVVMLVSVAGYAQHAVGEVTLKPAVGLNITTVTNSDGADPRIGLAAGAELEYQVTDIVSLSAGAIYSMQGVKGNFEGVDGTIKLDYINVPILANVYVVKGLAVKVGVQPGFMVNDKVNLTAGGTSVEVGLEEAFESAGVPEKVNKFDLSIPVGLSYEFNNIVIDGRYNFGTTKIIKGEEGNNSVFQLTLGYKFRL